MRDPHLNLFWSYRTAHIEDNVTRALLVVLRQLHPIALRTLLRDVFVVGTNREGSYPVTGDPAFTFALQVGTSEGTVREDLLGPENGVLVGITTSGSQGVKFDEGTIRGGARPDAIVTDAENGLTFVIESKLSDSLYREQLQRHFNAHFDPCLFEEGAQGVERVHKEVSWTDIVNGLQSLKARIEGDRSGFLIDELTDYLNDLGLIDFRGFRPGDLQQSERTLNAFLAVLTRELADDLSVEPYQGNGQIRFRGLKYENVYVHGHGGRLTVGSVFASNKKGRSHDYSRLLKDQSGGVRTMVERFRDDLDPRFDVALRAHSVLHRTRFDRSLLLDVGGEFPFPEGFESFVRMMTDREANAFVKQPGKDVARRLGAIPLSYNSPSETAKAHLTASADILQYLYFHVDATISEDALVGLSTAELVNLVGNVVRGHRRMIEGILRLWSERR